MSAIQRDALFTQDLYDFIHDLSENNNRDWFQANKTRYESHLAQPALSFIEQMEPAIKHVSPHYTAIAKKIGGSLFRIYRDVRFSKDKSPYKTTVGIHFRHEAYKTAYAPGFYVHISPGECFLGAGIWHPQSNDLANIREYIAEHYDEWEAIINQSVIEQHFEMQGDRLSRPPRGYTKDHPAIEYLKYKDFIAIKPIDPESVLSGDFIDHVGESFMDVQAMMAYLCRALSLSF